MGSTGLCLAAHMCWRYSARRWGMLGASALPLVSAPCIFLLWGDELPPGCWAADRWELGFCSRVGRQAAACLLAPLRRSTRPRAGMEKAECVGAAGGAPPPASSAGAAPA